MRKTLWVLIAAAGVAASTGCKEETAPAPAPKASTLQDTKPVAAGAAEFEVDKGTAKVSFSMEAPNEKLRGAVDGATTGKIQVPLTDVTKTTGHLYVDLEGLHLFKRVKTDDFKEEEENPLQNQHARTWLEITCKDVAEADMAKCEAESKKNKNVEFTIEKVETEQKDVTKMTGDERKVTATVTGTFLLHQIPKQHTAKCEIVFKMKGDKVESITIKTVEPFDVKLAEHEVRPRDTFGKLAKKTLDALINEDKKVAEAAQISLDLTAKFTAMQSGDTKPAASSAGSAK
jgi:hypothetical protein